MAQRTVKIDQRTYDLLSQLATKNSRTLTAELRLAIEAAAKAARTQTK